jgi:hypothetical protein
LRRVLPGGSLPGEGTTRGTVRIRVDTETGEVRWLRIMHWQAGPPTLQHQLAAATGRLEWHRPVRFSIRVCGRWIDMKQGDASAHTR